MSIRDEVASYVAISGTQCGVTRFLDSLEPKARAEVVGLLDDKTLTNTAFAKWSEKRGVRVSDQSWSRHRRSECSCGRS